MKLYVILVLVILAMTVLVDEVEAGRRRKTFKKLKKKLRPIYDDAQLFLPPPQQIWEPWFHKNRDYSQYDLNYN
ncbi:hypothetical protein QE152_g7717 [Popillia japonica]|uniref:Uncharacterized protein n=1 Tax=Popillia japonica TaxID=7064 RepID=A0AAW1MDS8_POPJA